ncbi:hypothetical protein IT072_19650 [Leifsonia sp. ZF2019]|uniref:FG-GAP repeat protein n=1 Tax=Leifsonia sp. ZF2019 TaxID=2781978 RepID=UPI001CBF02BE|nr:FG-GAP repeat protein [Leifsonia sp. ZF2019]UAJ79373.1 hypothetical protein IT072_19650 [Leifsonia sp. ZF2019]
MRRPTALRSLPALLIAVVLAVLPAAASNAADVYQEVASYNWDGQSAARVAISHDVVAVTRAISSTAGEAAVEVMRVDEAGTVLDSQTLSTPPGARYFGASLALDESRGLLYVGAYKSDQVFEYLLSTDDGDWHWREGRVFTPGDGTTNVTFGESLSLRGDRLAIGAYEAKSDDIGPYYSTGGVYVADLATGAVQRAGVTGLYINGLLGDEVLLTDRWLISSAHQKKTRNAANVLVQTGGLYVWDLDDLSTPAMFIDHPLWGVDAVEHRTGLFSSGGVTGGFGYALAANDTDLFVSSPGETTYTAEDPSDLLGGWNNSSVDAGTTTVGAIYRFSLSDLHQVGPKIVPPPHERAGGFNMAVERNALLMSSVTRLDGEVGEIQVYDIGDLATTSVPGDLMRQQPEPVQVLRGTGARPGDWFGGSLNGGGLRVDGGRAIVASVGQTIWGRTGQAYLFSPIIPNVTEWPMTVDAPSIVYGQEGRIAAGVPGLGVPVTVQLKLNGEQHEAGTDASGTAIFDFGPAEHPAGTYPAEVSFVAPGGRDTGTAATDYVVAKAPTTVVDTNVEVR